MAIIQFIHKHREITLIKNLLSCQFMDQIQILFVRTVCLRHNIDNNFQLILIIYIKTPLQYSRCKICSLHNQQNLKCVTTTTIFSNARNETQVWSLQHQTTKMATLACSLTLIFKVIIYERNWSYILSYYVPSFQVSYAERNKFLVQIFHTMCYYTSSE